MTRLLNTPIIGCTVARVASSRIDMLAGLSKCDSLRTPPCFWASAGPPAKMAIADPNTTVSAPSFPIISDPLLPLVTRQPRGDHDVVRPCAGLPRESAEATRTALDCVVKRDPGRRLPYAFNYEITREETAIKRCALCSIFPGARPLQPTRVGASGSEPAPIFQRSRRSSRIADVAVP